MLSNDDPDKHSLENLFHSTNFTIPELHPFVVRDAYDWNTSQTSRYLDIPLRTLQSYGCSKGRNRRSPSTATLQKVYIQAIRLIQCAKVYPVYAYKLPPKLAQLVPVAEANSKKKEI
jgi:hypothetical protein